MKKNVFLLLIGIQLVSTHKSASNGLMGNRKYSKQIWYFLARNHCSLSWFSINHSDTVNTGTNIHTTVWRKSNTGLLLHSTVVKISTVATWQSLSPLDFPLSCFPALFPSKPLVILSSPCNPLDNTLLSSSASHVFPIKYWNWGPT